MKNIRAISDISQTKATARIGPSGLTIPSVIGIAAVKLHDQHNALLYLANPRAIASMSAWGRYGRNCLTT
jgi:hypothetical protein